VDIHHEDLQVNIREARNFIPEEPYRAEIHGTAVAGIIGAAVNDTGIAGLAPEAQIVALRACRQLSETTPQGQGHSVSISRAIDAALADKVGIVNMSFGARVPDRLITTLIETGSRQGILFVAPVGNREDLSVPTFPASCASVIAVGGLKENGEPFPNPTLSAAATVCAPCAHLFTTIPGNRYNFLDGTSISAGIVSGLLALAREKRHDLQKEDLPTGCGAIRQWTEALLGISLDE
jgi:subtilisin family serine protease